VFQDPEIFCVLADFLILRRKIRTNSAGTREKKAPGAAAPEYPAGTLGALKNARTNSSSLVQNRARLTHRQLVLEQDR
jgi:hypothetical protein